MYKQIFLVTCAALALAGAPQYLEDFGTAETGAANAGTAEEAARDGSESMAMEAASTVTQASYTTGIRKVTIPLSHSGHFVADFRVNGRSLSGIVDTGATYVALNQSAARSLGVHLAASDFTHRVRTANGITHAALVTLDRIEIGAIRVPGVGALVLKDEALSGTLIGMSFMSKLSSYRVQGQQLELVE